MLLIEQALFQAIDDGDVLQVQCILKSFKEAIKITNDLKIKKEILKKTTFPDINALRTAPDESEETALFLAAKLGHTAIVAELLTIPTIRINIPDSRQRTPLYIAAQNNHAEIVFQLLCHRALTLVQTFEQKTALTIACEKGHAKIVELLLHFGAGINQKLPRSITKLELSHIQDVCTVGMQIGDQGNLLLVPGFEHTIFDLSGEEKSLDRIFRIKNPIDDFQKKILDYLTDVMHIISDKDRNNTEILKNSYKKFIKDMLILRCQEILAVSEENKKVKKLLNIFAISHDITLLKLCIRYIQKNPAVKKVALKSDIPENLKYEIFQHEILIEPRLLITLNSKILQLEDYITQATKFKDALSTYDPTNRPALGIGIPLGVILITGFIIDLVSYQGILGKIATGMFAGGSGSGLIVFIAKFFIHGNRSYQAKTVEHMMGEHKKCYTAFQNFLSHLPNFFTKEKIGSFTDETEITVVDLEEKDQSTETIKPGKQEETEEAIAVIVDKKSDNIENDPDEYEKLNTELSKLILEVHNSSLTIREFIEKLQTFSALLEKVCNLLKNNLATNKFNFPPVVEFKQLRFFPKPDANLLTSTKSTILLSETTPLLMNKPKQQELTLVIGN